MSAISGRDLICFSNDWNGDPLSKTHLMRLAARENRVLWVESLGNRAPRPTGRDASRIARKLRNAALRVREPEPNLHLLTPIAVPLFGQAWARELNATLVSAQVRAASRRLDFREPIALAYLPAAAPAIDRIGATLIVYHCVDDFSAFDGAGTAIANLERELVAKSDLVVCSAEPLRAAKARLHPNVELLRHGVDHAHFARALDDRLAPHPDVRHLPRPILGFVGLVESWVDLELLRELARRHSNGTVVIVGREAVDTSPLRREPNVVFLGRRPYGELPSILKGFEVGLCPFRESRVAQGANPLKVREYLAAGLPVVSSPIPEVARLPHCRIARGAEAFSRAVHEALTEAPAARLARSESVRSESWEARWEELAKVIAARIGAPSALGQAV